MKTAFHYFVLAILSLACATTLCAEEPIKHQITGLFSADRADDLRLTAEKLPNIKLVGIDYASAEATFAYDPAKAFPGAKPEQIVERFDNLLRQHSNSTFGVKPLCALPADKLTLVEIAVAGLDCKGCAWAAYGSIYKLDGVERATVSFKEGRAIALIDPAKTDRAALEKALEQKGVKLVKP